MAIPFCVEFNTVIDRLMLIQKLHILSNVAYPY